MRSTHATAEAEGTSKNGLSIVMHSTNFGGVLSLELLLPPIMMIYGLSNSGDLQGASCRSVRFMAEGFSKFKKSKAKKGVWKLFNISCICYIF